MKTFDEVLSGVNAKRKYKGYESYANVNSDMSFDEILSNRAKSKIQSLVTSYASGLDWLYRDYQSRYMDSEGNYTTTKYRTDSAEWNDSTASRVTPLKTQADEIKNLLGKYKDSIDTETYSKLSDYLDKSYTSLDDIANQAFEEHDIFSKYKNEDEYNADVEAGKAYDAYNAADLGALGVELEELKVKKGEYDELKKKRNQQFTIEKSKYMRAGKNETVATKMANEAVREFDEQLAQYGDIDKTLTDKTAYYNTASRIQRFVGLGSVADPESENYDPEFETRSAYNSTAKKNIIGKTYYEDDTYEYINNVIPGVRDELNREAMSYLRDNPWNDGETYYQEKGYDFIEEKEKQIYNYYYDPSDKTKSNEYLDLLQETFNARQAKKRFETLEDNTALELMFGVEAGLDQWASGVKNLFNGDDYIPTSSTQMVSGMVRKDLADDGFNVFGSSLGQVAYDAVTTTSNMLPSILLSAYTGGIGGAAGVVVSKVVGAASMGASAAGNAYQEMLNLGYGKDQARSYATLVGLSETGLEYLLGGISKLGGKASGNVIAKAVSGVDNAFARFAIKYGGSMLSEGLEEGLQEILNPYFENLIFHADKKVDWQQVAYSGLLGAISAGMLEGGSIASAEVNTYRAGKQIKEAGQASNLAKLGKSFAPDTVAYKIAGKVNENTGAYTIGRLLHEVGADGLTETNVADIVSSLEKTGIAPAYAKVIAKWVDNAVQGGKLSAVQQMALEMNEDVNMIVHDILINKNSTVNQRMQSYNAIVNSTNFSSQMKKMGVRTNEDGTLNREDLAKVSERIQAEKTAGGLASKIENTQDVSDDGKTYADVDGEHIEVTSREFVDGDDGSLKVKVNGDKVVDAGSVSYGDMGDAYVVSAIADLGVSAEDANALYGMFQGKGDKAGQAFANGISLAFKYGRYLQSPSKLSNIAGVTEAQAKEAYKIGRKSRSTEAKSAKAKLNEAAETNEKEGKKAQDKGTVVFEGNIADENGNLAAGEDSLTDLQKANVNGLKLLAELTPINFHIFQSTKDGKTFTYVKQNGKKTHANGWYVVGTNDIYIDLNAGADGQGAMMYTAAHEISHFIKQYSPEKWNDVAEYVMNQYTKHYGGTVETLLLRQINKVKNRPDAKDMTQRQIEDLAFEELVCDSLSKMLIDGTVVEAMANIKKQNKGVWNTIKNAVLKLLEKWSEIIKQYTGRNPDAEEAGYFKEATKAFKDLQKMFTEAFVDASETYSKTGNIKSEAKETLSGRDTVEESNAIEAFGKDLGDVERNADGDMLVATNKDNSTVMYSERTWNEGGKDKFISLMETLGHGDRAQEYAKYLDDALDYLHELAVGYEILGQHLDATITTDIKNGKQVLSAIVNNGEYPVNIDLALICKKRVAYMRLMAKMIEDGVFGDVKYDGDAIAEVNGILRKNGFETACLGCFVESRRLQFQTWAETIVQEWNEAVEARNKNARYFRFADGKASLTDAEIEALDKELASGGVKNAKGNLNLGKGSVEAKMGRLLDKVPSLARKLTVDDLLTPQGLTALRATDANLFSLVKQRYGAASPKIVQDYNPYASEIADLTFNFVKNVTGNAVKGAQDYIKAAKSELGAAPKKEKGESKEDLAKRKAEYNTKVEALAMRKYLYSIGGARIQSFSDFMIENVFDYLQIFADLSAKELPMHGYTKEIAALRLFGMTGAKWNGSLIAHVEKSMGKEYAGLLPASEAKDGNGILVKVDGKDYCIAFDDYARNKATNGKSFIQSIGMKDIIALMYDPRYSPYVGNITIGVSDKQIMAMLDSPLFRMVIPYHASGMLPQFAQLVGVDMYNDYTNYQNTTVKEVRLLDGVPYRVEIGDTGKPVVKNKDGDKIAIDTHYAFNEKLQKYGDARKTCYDYLAWCRNDHPIYDKGKLIGYATFNPKFSDSPTGVDFTKHRNYYKLIEDFNCYDNITEKAAQQGAVTMTFPSSENRLTAEQKKAYEKALRDTGIFTDADIKKYLEKADMTFEDIVRAEVGNRKAYNDAQEPKFQSTVKEVEDFLLNAKDEKGNYKFRRDAYADTASDYLEGKKSGVSLKPAPGSYGYMSRDVLEGVKESSRKESKSLDMLDVKNLARYYKEVYSAFNKTMPSGQMLLIGKTPDLLVKYGAAAGPLYLPQTAIKKNDVNGKHGLGVAVIYGLPEELNDPLAITGQTKKHVEQGDNAIVVWTNWKDANDNSIVVPVRIIEEEVAGERANIAVTVFDVHNEEYQADLLREGNIKYTKKNESIVQLLSQRRKVPKAMASNAFEHIIEDYERFVKENEEKLSDRTTAQLDADYMKAVEDGDMETVQRMVDEAAKRAGYTIEAYHGSRYEFNVFSSAKRGSSTNTETSKRWFFASDKTTANSYYPYGVIEALQGKEAAEKMKNKGKLYHLYLRMSDPLEVDVKDYDYAAHRENRDAMMEYSEQADRDGNDGIILYNALDNQLNTKARESTVYMFRDSAQAKSADPIVRDDNGNVIPLSKRFDSSEEDIRYSDRDSTGKVLTDEQLEFFKDSKVRDESGNLLVVYHGTPNQFTIFKQKMAQGWGTGIYFTDNRDATAEYGKNVVEAYLNITNPYNADTMHYDNIGAENTNAYRDFDMQVWKQRYAEYDTYEEYREDGMGVDMYEIYTEEVEVFNKILRELGYDGIIADNSNNVDGLEIVAFYNNQPKLTANTNPTEDPDIRYSDRSAPVSTRTLLANALESTIDTSTPAGQIELKKLNEYKDMVGTLDELTDKLNELRSILFKKGITGEERRKIQDEATKTANRISVYDKKLLTLEASKPLKKVLDREKAKAVKQQKAKDAADFKAYKEETAKRQKERMDALRESRKAAFDKVIETRDRNEARAKLQKLVLETAKWISYPKKEDVKCPDILRVPYADFLKGIDFSSKTMLEKGEQTRNDLRIASAMDSLATAIERIKNAQNPATDSDEVLDSGYLDLPTDFVDKLREMAEKTKQMILEGDYVVNRMSSEDIKQLTKVIRTLNHSIREMSTLYANLRFAKVEELGDASIAFMEAIGGTKGTNSFGDFLTWDNALPYYAFKRFGESGESVFEELMDSQDKLAFLSKIIFDFTGKAWTPKEAKAWSEDTHTIELPSGRTLTLTTADAMSIYCTARRDNNQGLNHLVGGGVRVLGTKKGVKEAQDSKANLDLNDVRFICDSLDSRQKEVAEKIQEFMSSVCSEWGNEISMKRFLTKDFTEKRYFPIQSNDEVLAEKDPQAQQSDLYRLLNISATKPLTPKANNSVIIRNIFDVFTEHTSDMARLNAYGMALLDYMKWINYNEKTTNDDGQISVRGVRSAMNNTYGKKARSYAINLIKDINGRFTDGGDHPWLMKMTRQAKTAMVGANLRVAILQGTAYPRAAMVLSNGNLAKGLMRKPQVAKAKKYCGIALWKSFGFYDTNISRSIEDQIKGVTNWRQKVIELSLKGAEWGDSITWGFLWNACEYEVARDNKQLKVGSEEFNEAVGKKLREVVYATQVVDSTLTRSQIMRSKSGLTQTATAFMSEPTVSANILMDAGFQFELEKRRTGSAKAAWKKVGGYVGKAVAVYSVSQLLAALVEGLMDAYRDDDDDEFLDKFGKAFLENAITDIVPFNKIPIIADVTEWVLSLFGVGYFSSDRLDAAWLTQMKSAFDSWSEVISGSKSTTTYYDAIYNTAKALSYVTGLPFSGAMREVVTLWNNTAGAADPYLKVRTYASSSTHIDIAETAFDRGDTASVKKAVSTMVAAKVKSGKTEKEAKSAVRSSFTSRYKEQYIEAYKKRDNAEMNRIRKLLYATGVYGTLTELDKTLQNWRTEE